MRARKAILDWVTPQTVKIGRPVVCEQKKKESHPSNSIRQHLRSSCQEAWHQVPAHLAMSLRPVVKGWATRGARIVYAAEILWASLVSIALYLTEYTRTFVRVD